MPETMPTTTLTPPTATLVRPTTSLTAPVTSATKPVTDLDFSKFFASNSPLTPFTWYGSDYLKGWYTVGSVPPARTQFDALHNLSDKKDKYLLDYAKYHDDYEEWLKNFDTYLVDYDKYLKSTDDYLNNFANYLLDYAIYHDNYDAFLKSCIDFLNRIKAPIDSPAFTGTPTAPTPADSDNSKRIATTAFVQSLVSALQSILNSYNSRIGTNRNDIDDLLSRIGDLESSGGGSGGDGGDSGDGMTWDDLITQDLDSYDGYIHFKDSLLIQWIGFNVIRTDSSGKATFIFPTSFTSRDTYNFYPLYAATTTAGRAIIFNSFNDTRTKDSMMVGAYDAASGTPTAGIDIGCFAFGW